MDSGTKEHQCKHPRKAWHSGFFGWVTCGQCGWLGFKGRKGMIWNEPRPVEYIKDGRGE